VGGYEGRGDCEVIHVVMLSYTEKVDTPVTVACVADSEEGGSTKVPLEY
jgi:hypothetical protein